MTSITSAWSFTRNVARDLCGRSSSSVLLVGFVALLLAAATGCSGEAPTSAPPPDNKIGSVTQAASIPCCDNLCGGGACASITACDDGDPCTNDACVNGFCQFTNNGTCVNPCPDLDANSCTVAVRDAMGVCGPELPVGDYSACSDGNGCTIGDYCLGGTCKPGDANPGLCDDNQPCTVDSCNPAMPEGQGCTHTLAAVNTPCTSGLDPDPCKQNVCDGINGNTCTHPIVADGTACASDSSSCTSDICKAGVCKHPDNGTCACTCVAPGTAFTINSFNGGWATQTKPDNHTETVSGTASNTNPEGGTIIYVAVAAGNTYYINMSITAPATPRSLAGLTQIQIRMTATVGAESKIKIGLSADGTNWTERALTGYVTFTGSATTEYKTFTIPLADFTGIDLSTVTMVRVATQAGEMRLDDIQAITPTVTTTCTYAGGTTCGCATGADCDDNSVCTADSCIASVGTGKVCQFTNNAAACNDGNPCTDDSCDPVTGCKHVTNPANPCSDGNDCTTDSCASGVCVGTAKPVGATCTQDANLCTVEACNAAGACVSGPSLTCANDGNPCTDDVCNPATGTCGVANAAACSDGNACTTGDFCSGGTCHPGAGTLVCAPDGNQCTNDACQAPAGCTYPAYANGTACNEGSDLCALNDTCVGGVCTAGLNTCCSDGIKDQDELGVDCGGSVCPACTGCVVNALTPTASNASAGTSASATDNNAGTFWTAANGTPQWIYLDLGADKQIGRVQLEWDATVYGGYYTIQVASGAAAPAVESNAWTSIYTQSLWDGTSHIDNITNLNAVGRYVRMYYWAPLLHINPIVGVKLREFRVYGDNNNLCVPASSGNCGTTSSVPVGPTKYENNAAGNTCAIVNGGAACATAAGGTGNVTTISQRGVLSFKNIDGGASGGAATITFSAAGASTRAGVYVKYADGTEQGYGVVSTTSAAYANTQTVQVWLKSGTGNSIELRDTVGAAAAANLPAVDYLTVQPLTGANKTCEGAPFVVDSWEAATDWTGTPGVTSGDYRAINKSTLAAGTIDGGANLDQNLRLGAAGQMLIELSNLNLLDASYVQLKIACNTNNSSFTLALTADGVNFNTVVTVTATGAAGPYGTIPTTTSADGAVGTVRVPISAFGVSSANLKTIHTLRFTTLSAIVWRIKDISITN